MKQFQNSVQIGFGRSMVFCILHEISMMQVTGFSFIRNAVVFDYPIVESIQSILSLCDDFVIAVGESDDETLELIKQIGSPKIRILETRWDNSLREGGKVLADETNKAFISISSQSDWAFYIQGDEVIHEKYLPVIKETMQEWINDKQVDGLLFGYHHFYGSYDYIGASPRWYRNEIRVIKNDKSIYSYKDAQGFRKKDNQKLNVKPVEAFVNHYGWVKEPKAMQRKQQKFNRLWHDDSWMDKNIASAEEFDYSEIDALVRYNDSHPEVMQKRISDKNWVFDYDISMNKMKIKDKTKLLIEKTLGIRVGEYKNYVII